MWVGFERLQNAEGAKNVNNDEKILIMLNELKSHLDKADERMDKIEKRQERLLKNEIEMHCEWSVQVL